MSDLIGFTRNHEDQSTDRGCQFKFFCDVCGNGYLSPFQASVASAATSLLHGLGSLAGGKLGRVGDAAYNIRRATGGKAHDAALRAAVEAVKPHFMQCSRCGKWVCKEICWNPRRGLCVSCAPKLEQELAAKQSEAELTQMAQKVDQVDYTKDLNVVDEAVAKCSQCGAETAGGKFCPSCGAPLATRQECPRCATRFPPGTRFCPGCGQKVG